MATVVTKVLKDINAYHSVFILSGRDKRSLGLWASLFERMISSLRRPPLLASVYPFLSVFLTTSWTILALSECTVPMRIEWRT